jgi:hypothetical protein
MLEQNPFAILDNQWNAWQHALIKYQEDLNRVEEEYSVRFLPIADV